MTIVVTVVSGEIRTYSVVGDATAARLWCAGFIDGALAADSDLGHADGDVMAFSQYDTAALELLRDEDVRCYNAVVRAMKNHVF